MDWASVLCSPVGASVATGLFVFLAGLIPVLLQLRDRKKERELQWGARLYEKRLTAFGATVRPILTIRALAPLIVCGKGMPENRSRYQNNLINLDWARHAQKPYLPPQFLRQLNEFADAAETVWVSGPEDVRGPEAAEKHKEAHDRIKQNAKVLLNEIGQAVSPWVDWFEARMLQTLKHPQKK